MRCRGAREALDHRVPLHGRCRDVRVAIGSPAQVSHPPSRPYISVRQKSLLPSAREARQRHSKLQWPSNLSKFPTITETRNVPDGGTLCFTTTGSPERATRYPLSERGRIANAPNTRSTRARRIARCGWGRQTPTVAWAGGFASEPLHSAQRCAAVTTERKSNAGALALHHGRQQLLFS